MSFRVTWFTEMIYTAITYAVAGGDATPFVGHNAILRWAAIQTAAGYHDSRDGYEKYWSEDHVSEDFAMSLCMLTAGYQLRYAAYQGAGFKEGVSLTVYDELARWEKYAYGVNEVIFHPWRKWLTRGPFTPLFRRFIGASAIPITHKLTILAYLGTYYAIASAFPLSAMNYFLTGWEYGIYDKFYRDSFSIFFSIILVFTCMGNVALATLRYRLKQGGLLDNRELASHPLSLRLASCGTLKTDHIHNTQSRKTSNGRRSSPYSSVDCRFIWRSRFCATRSRSKCRGVPRQKRPRILSLARRSFEFSRSSRARSSSAS